MRPSEFVGKMELSNQLDYQIRRKNQGIKKLIWGAVVVVLNLMLDGLYNTFYLLVRRGDLKSNWAYKLVSFLKNNFSLLFILWMLLWVGGLVLIVWGLVQWLTARGEIEVLRSKIK